MDERAVLTIDDQGPGIPGEKHRLIFSRFERAVASNNISGLGLGLYVTKQIVEAHHGSIRLHSANGHGCRFTIELPLNPPVTEESKGRANGE